MKSPKATDKKGRVSLRLLLGIALLGLLPSFLWAQAPGWWSSRGVLVSGTNVTPNDYAAVNQGQLKNLATAAYQELSANLPGGAGTDVTTLISKWSNASTSGTGSLVIHSGSTTNDYAAVNLGQLKTVAKPFYDRLIQVGYTAQYPWTTSTNAANDYAMANIGQVKNLFSFDVTYSSDDSDLPDWWKTLYNIAPGTSGTSVAPRGDGLSYLDAYRQGLNPLDYFDGHLPTLQIIDGNNLSGSVNTFVTSALVVHVTDSAGALLANAPVTFAVPPGSGLLRASETTAPSNSLKLLTDGFGNATIWYELPNVASSTNSITCTAVSGSQNALVAFTETSITNSGPITLYVDPTGNDWNSGISLAPGVNGPKQTISGGLSSASSGDTLQLATGTYTETSLQPGSKAVHIVPVGDVHIQ